VGCTPAAKLCEGLDPIFATFLRWARALVHGENPEHCALRAQVVAVWARERFGDVPGHVDWWAEYDKLLRAKAKKNMAKKVENRALAEQLEWTMAARRSQKAAKERLEAKKQEAARKPLETPLPPSPTLTLVSDEGNKDESDESSEDKSDEGCDDESDEGSTDEPDSTLNV
jgi:hypothetical protein